MSNRYHIKPNGEPGVCSAKYQCKYKLSQKEHYDTKIKAQEAYEKSQQAYSLPNVSKNITKPIDVLNGDYFFDRDCEDYGFNFSQPDIEGVYLEKFDDMDSEYWRFEQLEEIFYEFDKNDFQLGYSLNVKFHTLQRYLSEDIVEGYAKTKNPFTRSLYSYGEDNMDEDTQSLPIIMVHKGVPYIVDGNHRFAAAQRKGMKAFGGVVIGTNDDMSRMWLMSPTKFNSMFDN